MSQNREDELADALFAAARRERASAAVREKTWRALAAPPVSRARFWPLAAAALAACLGAGLFFGLRPSADGPRISAEPDTVRLAPPRRAPAPSFAASETARTVASAQPKSPVRVVGSAAQRPRAASVAPVAPATLEQELGLLDHARSAAAAGNSRGALAVLDDYEKVAKNGSLTAEARLLRIQVLAKAGERERATALARKFIADYPDSPLTDRARSYAALAGGGAPSSGVGP